MGSKAQAKASSENAKRMKEAGIKRTQCLCPIHGTHYVPVPFNGMCNRSPKHK